jgi:predicted GNAT family N-acyltransferase
MANIEISTDKNKLDINFIVDFLSNSYWAKGRTKETMQICINNSLNFGVYLAGQQIGYARVVTDYAQFAYLMDLFITIDYRGNGYSKELMKIVLGSEELKDVKVWRLATTDAHDLYKKFGFTSLAHPEKLMELIR